MIPGAMEMGPGMSAAMHAAALEVAAIVLDEIAQLGGRPRFRHSRERFQPWWLRRGASVRSG